jgi:glycosyltransferase involved in cell wall biosynthesis
VTRRSKEGCRISVIVPTLNEEAHIGRLLASLEVQTDPPHEVIVVDAGSMDATARIAKELGAKTLCFPGMKEWPSMNAGAEIAEGDVVLFTGADVAFPRRTLARIRARFSRDADLVGIAGPGIPVDPPALLGLEYAAYNLARFLASLLPADFKRFSTSTNLLAVKRSVFKTVGGLPDGWNADGRLGRSLCAQGRVRFFLFWVRTRISSRRLNEMGFWAFNRHFLYVIENFVPKLESWGPIRKSKAECAANHSRMRVRAGVVSETPARLSLGQWIRRKTLAPASLTTAVALFLGAWAVTSTWGVGSTSGVRKQPTVIHGSACPPLRRALEFADLGQMREVRDALERAESVAFDALESSGIRFGRTERAALRVQARSDNGRMTLGRLENLRLQLLKVDALCDQVQRDA